MLWLDGTMHAETRHGFDFADRGLLLADGLFETLPAFLGRPLFAEAHLDRLMAGAQRLGFTPDRTVLSRALTDIAAADAAPGAIRLTVTRGSGPRGLIPPVPAAPLIFATRAPLSPTLAYGEARLATSTIRRNPTSPSASLKTLAYLDNVMAFREAREAGADDALMRDTDGALACTSMGNLFLLRDGMLVTPPLDGAVLPGITRALILACATEQGITCREARIAPEDLTTADAAFMTNSLRFMTRVTTIDGIALAHRNDAALGLLAKALSARVHGASGGFALPSPLAFP